MAPVPEPALATLRLQRFWRLGRVYERKLDDQRCLAVRDKDGTRSYSRSGRDVTVAFPEVAEAFEGSRTSFARLQPRIHLSSADRAG